MAFPKSSETMRIMLVNGSLFGGGAERVIATLARHLRELGHEVIVGVIHHGGEVQDELVSEGIEVISRIAQGSWALTAARLGRLLHRREVDVVHSHDLRSLVDAGLCRLQSRRLVHVHTFHFGNYPHVPRKELLLEGAFARVPDRLVAVGNAQRDSIIRALRLAPVRIRTLWNGVNYSSAVPVREVGADDGDVPLIGSVSTFGRQKGLPTLLDAASLLQRRGIAFRLMLVGEGELRGELEARVRSLGIAERVEFTGWRADAATSLLPTFDIFVQSSHWEAMSIVILEAMAAGRPIVATAVGENTHVLGDGRSAILVPPCSAEALADGLARAIVDRTLRRRIAAAARDDYLASFTGEAMSRRYSDMYHECMAGRPGAHKAASIAQPMSEGRR